MIKDAAYRLGAGLCLLIMIFAIGCFYILLYTIFAIIHPIEYGEVVTHNWRHRVAMDCCNFRFDVWCQECGKVFVEEIE